MLSNLPIHEHIVYSKQKKVKDKYNSEKRKYIKVNMYRWTIFSIKIMIHVSFHEISNTIYTSEYKDNFMIAYTLNNILAAIKIL